MQREPRTSPYSGMSLAQLQEEAKRVGYKPYSPQYVQRVLEGREEPVFRQPVRQQARQQARQPAGMTLAQLRKEVKRQEDEDMISDEEA